VWTGQIIFMHEEGYSERKISETEVFFKTALHQ